MQKSTLWRLEAATPARRRLARPRRAATATASGRSARFGPAVSPAHTIRLQDGRVLTIIEQFNPEGAVLPVGAAVLLQTRGHVQRVPAAAT